ncbi:MAG: hypothetical protein P4L92_16545 [Rudaea sp.]|nr:hypothetical protein [Rudaea sp.]
MKKIIAITIAAVLAACVRTPDSGKPIAVANAGFEQPASESEIPGWTTVQHAGPPAYEMVVDTREAYEGHASFRMTRKLDQLYGSIKQTVSVAAVAGESVELSAMMKTKDVGPQGWKLMILDIGVNGREFSPAITGTSDWQRVSVRAHLPKGISTIVIGATLLDGGSGWIDDVKLSVVAP